MDEKIWYSSKSNWKIELFAVKAKGLNTPSVSFDAWEWVWDRFSSVMPSITQGDAESTIILSGSSQGESSVLRVRLRVIKNPLRICTSPL